MAAPQPSTSTHHPQNTSIADIQMSDASLNNSNEDNEEPIVESQEESYQETQPVDEPEPSSQELRDQAEYEATLWGYLHPCSAKVNRVDFLKTKDSYLFGRLKGIDVYIDGGTVSQNHCRITYDARTDQTTIFDLSSNGTYVSSSRIGKGKSRILRAGNEISFGPSNSKEHQEYRWLYRHIGNNKPDSKSGIWEKYELGSELGRGTFASVYRCMERDTGKWFAVKIIQRAKFASSPINERNFNREIQLLTKMHHPNIVQLIEVFEDDETYYLVMEEVTGGELLVRITGRDGLPEAEAQYVTYQVCLAMAFIHKQNIAHRDLKPENILLTSDSPPIAKVADFGLAKLVDDGTFLKTMCGTPSYLAPEIVIRENGQGYNHLVDSWSMGVICFAMITNTGPFIEDTTADIHRRILSRRVHWETLVHSENISDAGIDFISNLLRVEPTERMSLTEALDHPWLRDLTNSLRSPPPSPRRPAIPGQPIVPRHYTGTSTMNTLGQSTYANMSTVSTLANVGGSPVQTNQVLPDCSQDFENLRLDSEGLNTPRRPVASLPSIQLDVNSQGEIQVPGFSPWKDESQGSQRSAKSGKATSNADATSPGANGQIEAVEAEASPNPTTRKRKTKYDDDDRDSSPLTEPPEGDSGESSEDSSRLYELPVRQAKSHKKTAGDSPAVQSHTKPKTKAKAAGTGRAGARKGGAAGTSTPAPTSRKGKGKAVETAQETEGEPGPSTNARQLRRSTRKSAK